MSYGSGHCHRSISFLSRSAPGGAGLSPRHLLHLHLPIRALPQRPRRLPQGDGQSGETHAAATITIGCWSCTENFLISTDAGVFLLRCAPVDCLHLRLDDTRMWLDVGLDHLLCRGHGSGQSLNLTAWYFHRFYQMLDVLLCSSSRPSGATWEHHCILELLSHIESQLTSGGLLLSSTSCSPLRRLCWPCAATTTRLILWNLFPGGRPTVTRRKTRRLSRCAHDETRPVPSGDPWCA